MSDKSKPTEDLLEKSIIDAKKVKQVAMQSAERSLKQKYSDDLRKMYLNKLNEETDFDLNLEGMLEEDYSLMGEDEDPMAGLGDPLSDEGGGELGGEMPGQDPMGGAPGGDMGIGGGTPPPGGGLDQGPAPAPNSVSPVEPQLPATHDDITLPDGSEPDEIELELVFDKDQSLPGDVNQFMQNDMGAAQGPEGLGGGGQPPADPMAAGGMPGQDPMGGLGGEQQPGMEEDPFGGEFGLEDEDPFAPQQPKQQFDLASIQIDDDVLLEYIEKSLKNDEVTKKLRDDLQLISTQVSTLSEQLDKSNQLLEDLQKQNLRLIYQNKALVDDSLSEHQKQHIVKALDKAETLNEAKVIFDIARTNGSKPKSNPMNQIHGARATGTTNLLRENRTGMLPQADRWQELAGIKKSK